LKSNFEISQRYVKVFYEFFLESKLLKNIEKDVLNFKNLIIKNSNLNELIKSHVISRENKAKVIEKILKKLKSYSLIVKFIGTIALNGRMNFIEDIIEQFLNKLSIERGEIKAELTTALLISNEINIKLIKEVKKLKKSEKIELKTNVDKSLFGGLVLQVG
jgi:ATP synthase, F1 delta subunit